MPPATLMGSLAEDILLLQEVIGAGEICISDERCTDPDAHELARLVSDTHNGGMLSGKAGVTHFHVGSGKEGLQLLRTIMESHHVRPEWLYPTHVERTEALMTEALDLVRLGATIDIDVVEKDLHKWLRFYFDRDGNPNHCTISSDAFLTGPQNLYGQLRRCVLEHDFPLEQILPLATSNTAHVLKLAGKGHLAAGSDADVLIVRRESLEIVHVIARGTLMVEDGRLIKSEGFLEASDRRIDLTGHKHKTA